MGGPPVECPSEEGQDINPMIQAHQVWSDTMLKCVGDSYWLCVRLNTESLVEVLETQRPLWTHPSARAHLNLFEAAYRLERVSEDENPNARSLVEDVSQAWNEWLGQ